jgi:tRNA(fMet)-specific endonuclease VapC
MLNTNFVGYFLAMHPNVKARVIAEPINALCISAITEGELLFCLAKRPRAEKLHMIVQGFLQQIDVLPWDCKAAKHYGILRSLITRKRESSAPPFDLLIAAHAMSVGAVFVTQNEIFTEISDLQTQDWTVPERSYFN